MSAVTVLRALAAVGLLVAVGAALVIVWKDARVGR